MPRIVTKREYLEFIQIVSLLGPKLPDVSLGSSKVGLASVDLSSLIEQIQ